VSDADPPTALPDDFCRLGELLPVRPGVGSASSPSHRVADVWEAAVGRETARHAQPISLRGGRLIVATSSSVWAQTLQLMADTLRGALNDAMGEEVVTEIVCRPAGWDPGAARDAAPALERRPAEPECEMPSADPASWEGERRRPVRALTAAEERAIVLAQEQAGDPALGERIGAAMRASWARLVAPIVEEGPPEARG
jgi:Dna[CI] antecedent, DciA